jgi:hypothetical protein
MRLRRVQFFFVASLLCLCRLPLLAEPSIGQIYALNFTDVDGNTLSTADGHVTVIALSKEADVDKARLVGDRVPEYCLGNPTYRLITVIGFENGQSGPTRMILDTLARRRLDAEAKKLQPRYLAKKLTRDPRGDVFAVLDFDGAIAGKLGIPVGSSEFQVLVLDRKGKLLERWTDVPTAEQLAAVLK